MKVNGVNRKEREYSLNKSEPNWVRLTVNKGVFVSYEFPNSIQDIVNDVPLKKRPAKSVQVKIAPNPFAKGVERLAFYGRDLSTYVDTRKDKVTAAAIKSKTESIVLKEYLLTGKGMNSAKRYEFSNQMQTIAAFLATKFVEEIKRVRRLIKNIKFIKIRTLYLPDGPRYMSVERRFDSTAKFIRFSNNATYEIMEKNALALGVSADFVQLVTAFSHWTHKVTKGFLMVVDLEGVIGNIFSTGEVAVIMTDPAIHCKDLTR